MLNPALSFLLYLLFASILSLFIASISKKLYMDTHEKKYQKNKEAIVSRLENFIDGNDEEYIAGLNEFIQDTLSRGSNYLAAVDEYLLEILDTLDNRYQEYNDKGNRKRFMEIASRLGFPSECRAQIKNKNSGISALGSRRAGLYKVTEAVQDMEAAINTFPGENQSEILMALARMGEANALKRVFEKIKTNIIINEREVTEILSAFPEGKSKRLFFRLMIRSDTDFFTTLFFKALTRDMTKELLDDIIYAFQNGTKEVRAAAVRSLSTLDKDAPADILISALNDKDWEVRALAAKALGPVKRPEASSALYQTLYDRQWWVRQNAANALAGHPGFETLFILAAESGDEYVKDSIISALENGANPVLLRSIRIMVA